VRARRGQFDVFSAPVGGAGGGGRPAGLRVLLVDDDADVTEMMTLALQTEGWSVDALNRPEEAVEAGARGGYDVLVVDLIMPTLDGVEVLRRLRGRGVTTPALLLTGRRGATEAVDLTGLGVERCLEKPIGLEALFGAIAAAVKAPAKAG
jgi:DNA-binding response OmpR family regulator